MEYDIDFDINNYNFVDLLNLFNLSTDYTKEQLENAKNILIKIHPNNSHYDKKYYDLFLQAYNIIQTNLKEKKIISHDNTLQEVLKKVNNVSIDNDDVIDNPINIINSCYNQKNYNIQLVTIHTEDRDINKYPLQNNFEVELPQVFKNVLSLELYDITLPTYYYNISEILQNTSLWFSVPYYFDEPIELKMESGFYTNTSFIDLFIEKLNQTTTSKLYSLGVYALPSTTYTEFDASLNAISSRITVFNKTNEFKFWCQKESIYNDCLNDNWNMLIEWGLPYNLGFNKLLYISTFDPSLNLFSLIAPNYICLNISNTIYMEIDKFNYINENRPFSKSTTTYYNNDYNGTVNSAFAKLILSNVTNTYVPITKFKRILPHIEEKIGRLKFRFRYHNGNLVDFLKQNFNFSLKLVCRFDCKY